MISTTRPERDEQKRFAVCEWPHALAEQEMPGLVLEHEPGLFAGRDSMAGLGLRFLHRPTLDTMKRQW